MAIGKKLSYDSGARGGTATGPMGIGYAILISHCHKLLNNHISSGRWGRPEHVGVFAGPFHLKEGLRYSTKLKLRISAVSAANIAIAVKEP